MSTSGNMSPGRELLTIQVALRFCAAPGRYQWKGEAGRFQAGLEHRDDIVDWHPEPDPWETRKAFFKVNPDDVIALDLFVDRFGRVERWDTLTTAGFAQWKELLEAAMKLPMSRWGELSKRFPAGMVSHLTRPAQLKAAVVGEREPRIVIAGYALEAIILAIAFDKMRGFGFRRCAWCRDLFRKRQKKNQPGRARICCSDVCAHRKAVHAYKQRNKERTRAREQEGR